MKGNGTIKIMYRKIKKQITWMGRKHGDNELSESSKGNPKLVASKQKKERKTPSNRRPV